MKKVIGFALSAFFVLSSLYAAYDSSSAAGSYYSNQINWLKSYSEAVNQSRATSKPILILFTGTNWCPACMKLERDVLTKPEFAQAVGNQFVFLKADFPSHSADAINRSPYKSLMDQYGIGAFPSIVVVNANGQQLFTVNYQAGGPDAYIRELMQKLNQAGASSMSYTR